MISRSDLEENPWKDPMPLSDDQVEEELLLPLIEKLNRYREMDVDWTCCGDTLVATRRHRLDDGESTTFFVCKIHRFFQTK